MVLGRSHEVIHASILLKHSVSQFPFVYGLYTESHINFLGVNTFQTVLNLELLCTTVYCSCFVSRSLIMKPFLLPVQSHMVLA